MRRLLIPLVAALALGFVGPTWAQDDDDDEPGAFVEYLSSTGRIYAAGFNGILTFPVDFVMAPIEGDETFDSVPAPAVTGRAIGFGAGIIQGFYRLLMGAYDVILAPLPYWPMVSPAPRVKLIPGWEHDDE